jgi:putative membrane protein
LRILGWLLALPLIVLAVVFAVANRHDVRLELWPFPWMLDLPVYLAVLGALLAGILIGAIAMWLSGHRTRMNARQQRRRADSLERQLEAARAEAEAAKAALAAPPQTPAQLLDNH